MSVHECAHHRHPPLPSWPQGRACANLIRPATQQDIADENLRAGHGTVSSPTGSSHLIAIPRPYHSRAVKVNFIPVEPSTEEGYERAWVRFKGALCGEAGKRRRRWYPTAFVEKARESLLWKDKETVSARLEENRGEREGGEGGWEGGIVVRAPDREGVE